MEKETYISDRIVAFTTVGHAIFCILKVIRFRVEHSRLIERRNVATNKEEEQLEGDSKKAEKRER